MKSYLAMAVAGFSILLSWPAKAVDLTADGASNSVILWNSAALEAVSNTRFGPPMTARALSILQTGIFDAWAVYDPVAVSTQPSYSLQRPEVENTLSNKNEAINYAAYRILVDLFPTQVDLFNSLMLDQGYEPTNLSADTTTAVGIGNVVAQGLLDLRHNDRSNQLGTLNPSGRPYSEPILQPNYVAYTPVNTVDQLNNVNNWQPLRLADGSVQQYLTPHWGSVTPFGLTSGSQFRPEQGPKTTESDPEGFKAQAQQVLDISENLTDEQKLIADYWSDGPGSVTPPGHWNLIAQEISQRDSHSLDDDVEMFFALNAALFDASIAVWDAKRVYNSVRPITAINYLFKDDPEFQAKYPDGWKSYIGTPPFPEFVSGHSTFSAAAAETLKLFTQSDYYGGAYTAQEAGITLSWDTFSEAAAEAGMSRVYGGIHFMDGNLAGQEMGRKVAAWDWNKTQSYIQGTPVPEPSSWLGILTFGTVGVASMLKRQRQ